MSFYNMMHGFNPCVLFILPMLGKHPDEYPRFRDCFIGDESHPEYDNKIIVYTRTGGGNRDDYVDENKALTEMPGYITDYDDDFDSTYASFVFEPPEQWKQDFEHFTQGEGYQKFSKEYVEQIKKIFPKLEEKLNEIFPESS